MSALVELNQRPDLPDDPPPEPNTMDRLVQRAAVEQVHMGADDSFGFALFGKAQQGHLSFEEAEALAETYEGRTRASAKGVAMSPMGYADIAGWFFDAVEFTTDVVSQRAYGDDRGTMYAPSWRARLNSQPARDIILGEDKKHELFAFIGEMGGIEGMIAKAPVYGAKIFNALMHIDPQATYAMLLGASIIEKPRQFAGAIPKGAANAAKARQMRIEGMRTPLAQAEKMLGEGAPDHEILQKTGWYRDFREQKRGGKDFVWKKIISDEGARMRENNINRLIRVRGTDPKRGVLTARAEDVFEHDELYEAYPQLKDTKVHLHYEWDATKNKYVLNDDTKEGFGQYDPVWKEISIFNESPDFPHYPRDMQQAQDMSKDLFDYPKNDDWGKTTILHELGHRIQHIEHWNMGHSPSATEPVADMYIWAKGNRNLYDDYFKHNKINKTTLSFDTQADVVDWYQFAPLEEVDKHLNVVIRAHPNPHGKRLLIELRNQIRGRPTPMFDGENGLDVFDAAMDSLADANFNIQMQLDKWDNLKTSPPNGMSGQEALDRVSRIIDTELGAAEEQAVLMLRMADDSPAYMKALLEVDGGYELAQRAWHRYFGTLGEASNRLVQSIRDKSLIEIKNMLRGHSNIDELYKRMMNPVDPDALTSFRTLERNRSEFSQSSHDVRRATFENRVPGESP